ncbi:hypothetical protein NIES4071_13900 [Calothrix sp. NIES-4071]|nr:hypothetical protein NIES4071_13900 [Calothrix sp. NIES-4071]BAZ55728.1 hypothetical protein NIES4105_13850 [Calothrix sp. NIES-4105]
MVLGIPHLGGTLRVRFSLVFCRHQVMREVFSAPPITPGFENLGLEDSELPIRFSASIVTVPEPTGILSLLVFGFLGAASSLKRNKHFHF